MITLEIKDSPDNNAISSFTFFQNQIYLGRCSGDLRIADQGLADSHAMLEVVGKDLIIHAQKGVEFYLINGKRASAVRKIKIGDQVTLGKTTLTVLEFTETSFHTKKEILDQKLGQLVEENAPRLSTIEALTKLMKT